MQMEAIIYINSRHIIRSLNISKRLISTACMKFQSEATTKPANEYRHHSEIPGPTPKPFIKNSLDLMRRKDFNLKKQHIMFGNMAKEYGPLFKIEILGVPPLVFTADPDDCEAFHRANLNNPSRLAFLSFRALRHEDQFFQKKGGILAENGDEWWRVRSRTQTPLTKPGNAIRYLPQLDEVVQEFMDIIENHQQKHEEMPKDFLLELYKFSLEGVSLVNFDRRMGCLDPNLPRDSVPMKLIDGSNEVLKALTILEFSNHWWKIYATPPYKKMRKAHEVIKNIVIEQIEITQKNLKNKKTDSSAELTLLETFLKTPGLSLNDITTIILDLTFAGIDTTSHTLAFTLYCLARNPDVQKKVHEEVDKALGDGSGPLTEDQLKKIPYIKACVKETLRLFPIVFGTARTLNDDIILSGYKVPKGWQAFSLNFNMGRDENIFSRALEFVPERWGKDRPLGPIHPFASIPFNYGKRMCIGRRIAEQEIYAFLARAMHRYRIDYKYKDIEYVTNFVGSPSEDLRFEFHSRR